MDPLGGVVNANLRIFPNLRVHSSNLPNSQTLTILSLSLSSVYPTSSFPHEHSELLVTGPFLTLYPTCPGLNVPLMLTWNSLWGGTPVKLLTPPVHENLDSIYVVYPLLIEELNYTSRICLNFCRTICQTIVCFYYCSYSCSFVVNFSSYSQSKKPLIFFPLLYF